MSYRIIIGLETHVQLLTKTKLFCGCSTRFGLPPNSATCPVCIGMPGSLPVMNREAFRLALKAALGAAKRWIASRGRELRCRQKTGPGKQEEPAVFPWARTGVATRLGYAAPRARLRR